MAKRLWVSSPYSNIRGSYFESGSCEGRPAYAKDGDAHITWIFYSKSFARWHFGKSLPQRGSFNSFCRSVNDAVTPEAAQWPSEDITEISEEAEAGVAAAAPRHMTQECASCRELQSLSPELACPSCASFENKQAAHALTVLKGHASSATLQRLAVAFARGDGEVKCKLEIIAAAYQRGDAEPLIISEPPSMLELGVSTTTLNCEAFCFNGAKLHYQWCKDDVPLPRAERQRFMLCNAGPNDEGSYVCQISVPGASVSTRACEVRLSEDGAAKHAEAVAKRSRYESPLRRASEAQRVGEFETAVTCLTEAIKAAESNESVILKALCERAQMFLKLSRWQDAFSDSSAAIKISPGLARAHAARGTAAMKLGLLAEAASSWETAELLGGVPEASQEAEACRQRLQEFFGERQSQRDETGHRYTSSAEDAFEDEAHRAEGPEATWRRNGWRGRYTGGAAGSFFGTGGSSSCDGRRGGYSGSVAPISPELQRHLKLLELSVDSKGALPSAELVRGAYRRLALLAHPDKPGGSKTAFQELQNAYEALLRHV